MAKTDYRQPVESVPGKPFAERAAQVAFWSPMAVVLLSLLFTYAARSSLALAGYRQAFGWFSLGLNCLAVLAGLAALLTMRGRPNRSILIGSCVGLLLGGYFISSAVYLAYSVSPADRFAQRLVGEWEITKHGANGAQASNLMALRADRTASIQVTVVDKSLTLTGRWGVHLADNAPTQLAVKWNPGTDSRLGDGAIWIVEKVDDHQLTLLGPSGDPATREIYQRK